MSIAVFLVIGLIWLAAVVIVFNVFEGFLALCGLGIVSAAAYFSWGAYTTSHYYQADEAARAQTRRVEEATEADAAIPRVLTKSSDGCTVYSFKADGMTHYFTRCGNETVSTDRTYLQRVGKGTVARTETVVVNGGVQ